MLVQFMLKNVLSFKDETVLDMTAINAYKEHESNLIDIKAKEKFLRVAAIYGANASGKSNLYLAMTYFQRIIVESLNNVDDGANTAIKKFYVPFSFENDNRENSEFQIIEILGDFEYRYGFEYNAECIVMEWLYRKNLKTNRTAIIFERTTEAVEFGAAVRKECEVYKEQLPVETLALSFLNKLKLKTDIFRSVYSGIMDTLVVPTNFCEDARILQTFLPQVIDHDKEKLVGFLNAIDTGIKDIKYDDSDKETKFVTFHKGRDEQEYPLDLYYESEGTIKSIMLFIYARMAIHNNRSIFVDELNVKLHPLLLKFIIDLFYNETSTAQLIYTTHDTTLMDKKFFRRDQIWFVQKDEFGYSELVALSDFKVRSDASFEKDYLAGVYGGIPLLRDFDMKEGE
ncbi:ATP-binding protein [Blautia schinkii]|nr:ATP-binding protein [Blautia schinkii]